MKNRNFLVMLFMAIFTMIGVTSCNDDEEDKKVTGYKEYTLTVASAKLPGVLTSSDNNVLTDVYAVKNEQSTDWVIEVVVERGREDGVDIVRENRNTYSWVDICLEIHGPKKSDAGA